MQLFVRKKNDLRFSNLLFEIDLFFTSVIVKWKIYYGVNCLEASLLLGFRSIFNFINEIENVLISCLQNSTVVMRLLFFGTFHS